MGRRPGAGRRGERRPAARRRGPRRLPRRPGVRAAADLRPGRVRAPGGGGEQGGVVELDGRARARGRVPPARQARRAASPTSSAPTPRSSSTSTGRSSRARTAGLRHSADVAGASALATLPPDLAARPTPSGRSPRRRTGAPRGGSGHRRRRRRRRRTGSAPPSTSPAAGWPTSRPTRWSTAARRAGAHDTPGGLLPGGAGRPFLTRIGDVSWNIAHGEWRRDSRSPGRDLRCLSDRVTGSNVSSAVRTERRSAPARRWLPHFAVSHAREAKS